MQVRQTKGSENRTQADAILAFYQNINPAFDLPGGIEVMNPFQDKTAWEITELFYRKFYNDTHQRVFIFGINPGRFGGGITGIPFTDPIRLESECEIKNDFKKQAELSSIFVYDVIKAYGGTKAFYNDFLITALSPLGFTRNGLNLNYYDDKQLLKSSEAFIVNCIRSQQQEIYSSDSCYCLGEGINHKIFSRLNEKYGFFKQIVPLPHPRWIMQYRRKKLSDYVKLYIERLRDPGSMFSRKEST